jgi:hypothetical protein
MYRKDSVLTTFAGNGVSSSYAMNWAVGGVAMKWTLTNGSTTYSSCAAAGVTDMTVNFQDAQGNLVYGQAGDPQKCDAAPIVYNFLQPGVYKVLIRASGPNGVYFSSNFSVPPQVQVDPGVFPTAAQAINVTMYKQ